MIQVLTDLFNTSPRHRRIPKAWNKALIVLIRKEIHQILKTEDKSAGVFKHSSTKDDSCAGLPQTT